MVVFDGAVSILTEIFKVVDEVGQLPLPVDSLACRTHRVGERTRTATEDTNFADLKYVQYVCTFSLQSIINEKLLLCCSYQFYDYSRSYASSEQI